MTAPSVPPPSSADSLLPSRLLRPWLGLQIAGAALVLVVAARSMPILDSIALPWSGLDSGVAVPVGVAFWLAFGLIGGVRARMRAGGSVMTFSMPFIVAGTVLGGPFAGALLGLVSEFEIREIRTLPWYGTLANHAVSILSAVTAGVLGETATRMLAGVPMMQSQPAIAFFIVALVTAFSFAAANVALVVPTLAFKNNIGLGDARHSYDASFRATSVGEAVLAWLMAVTYVAVGFWAPIACVFLVLIIWQAFDGGEALRRDQKTGLLNELGFSPRINAALDAARLGRHSAAAVQLDLDKFKRINDLYLEAGGDEVIREVARRLLAAVRGTDSVARSHLAGDEYYVLLENVPDMEVAVRLVARLQATIRQPLLLRSHGVRLTVNASAGVVLLEPGTRMTKDEVYTLLNSRMKRAKRVASRIVFEGNEDAEALERRRALGPSRDP
ncbi:MAG: GGDEF domain-containing protein [Chloroflexi bacterium]|nr:GGDEF domain-containing protein [Chloroflexota bacterium]